MALLITGANGYVGRHVWNTMTERQRADCITADLPELDLSDAGSVDEFFKTHSIDRVLHMAAVLDNGNQAGLLTANITGLYNLLTACRNVGVRYFCFVSTNNVYSFEHNEMHSEDEGILPECRNPYAITKFYGELAVAEVLSGNDTAYAIIRLGDVYGPNQKTGALIKAVVENILAGRPQKLYGVGDRTRDYIYIDDVAAGLCHVVSNELIGTFNLATGVGTSAAQIIALAQRLYPCAQETIHMDTPHEDHTQVILDVRRLAESGFTARIRLTEGLKMIVEKARETNHE